MLSPQPDFRSQLLQGANTVPWSLLDVLAAFPEDSGHHAVEGEWSIRDQVLHLQNVEVRYTIPNLRALRSNGSFVPFGDDDREPDTGEPLEALAQRLAEIYDERVAALRQLLPAGWRNALARPDAGPVNAEEILTEECVQHDAEHLAQLLGTLSDWQKSTGQPGAHREGTDMRAILLAAADSASESLLGTLAVIPEECADHRPAKEGEWNIKEQVRHLIWVDRRFTMPNVRAILEGRVYIPYAGKAGIDDLEPDTGTTLDDLRRDLRATYDERNALMMSVPTDRWLTPLERPDADPVSVEYLIVHECVRHDNEHLSQLLGTARQWRVAVGEA